MPTPGPSKTDGPSTGPRRRHALRRAAGTLVRGLLLTSITLGVSIAAAEVSLRTIGIGLFPALSGIYDFYENAPDGSLRLQPGYRGVQVVEGRPVRIELNSLGMRSPEPATPAPAGERRVLFLGDSIPFGHGVEMAESFPHLAAGLLGDALGAPVLEGNAGIPGNAHNEQVANLEQHLDAFDPELIVSCVYTGNDFEGDFYGPKKAIEGMWFGTEGARHVESSWRARLALKLRTAAFLEKLVDAHAPFLSMDKSALTPTAEEAARYADFPAQRLEGLFMDRVETTPLIDEVLARMDATLDALQRRAGDREVVVVIVPSFVEVWPGIHEAALQATGVAPEQLGEWQVGLGSQRLAERARARGMRVLDMTPAMRAHPEPLSLYLLEDKHLSVAGNAFVAEHVAGFLEGSLRSRN